MIPFSALRDVRSWPVSMPGSSPRSLLTFWVMRKGDSRGRVWAAPSVRLGRHPGLTLGSQIILKSIPCNPRLRNCQIQCISLDWCLSACWIILDWKVLKVVTESTCLDPLDLGLDDDDDQHDYDSVASDEDTDSELTAQNNNTQRSNRAKVNRCSCLKASAHPCATVTPNTSLLSLISGPWARRNSTLI